MAPGPRGPRRGAFGAARAARLGLDPALIGAMFALGAPVVRRRAAHGLSAHRRQGARPGRGGEEGGGFKEGWGVGGWIWQAGQAPRLCFSLAYLESFLAVGLGLPADSAFRVVGAVTPPAPLSPPPPPLPLPPPPRPL